MAGMVRSAANGSFAFVLHSHIPYVLAHGQWPHGTDWLTEVAAESYIPILDALNELVEEGISPKITVGLTPILCEQLADESFKDEFSDWLETNIGNAAADARKFRASGDAAMLILAHRWRDIFRHVLHQFEFVYARDIVGAFRKLQDDGHIEIITSAATHGYLPLLLTDDRIAAQVKIGIASYERHFGRRPAGMWLPECAYRPRYHWRAPLTAFQTPEPILRRGVDEFLSDEGIQFTFVDSHLIKGGEVQAVYTDRFGALRALWNQFRAEQAAGEPLRGDRTEYRPYFVASSGDATQTPLAVFSRDVRSSQSVWAADVGYPGDPQYLEFHKAQEGSRLRYWRISENKADMETKRFYEPAVADARIREHARYFVSEIKTLIAEQRAATGDAPIIASLYDTELFGHWWNEGPRWLKEVLRGMANEPEIERTTCSAYLRDIPESERRENLVSLPEGSWGEGGFHWVWLNPDTEWIWKRIYDAEQRMTRLTAKYGHLPEAARPLQQAARELLLLESSDWPFVTTTKGAPDYAEARVKAHHGNFTLLAEMIERIGAGEVLDSSPWRSLAEMEQRDNPFPNIGAFIPDRESTP